MESVSSISVPVSGPDQAAEARRTAARLASNLEFDEAETGRVALVVTECASNLWKHAGGGEILLRPLAEETAPGIEVLALDKGPGMRNVAMCFRDGYSTAGSPGTGLGAIQRLSSECRIYTAERQGTALLARIQRGRDSARNGRNRLETGAVCVPKQGEDVCGDGWAVHQDRDFASLLVVDGLGHGPAAADSARKALASFRDTWQDQPVPILQRLHGALRATRGAAVAVARLDFAARIVRFAGVGNVAGSIQYDHVSRQMISLPGIAGHDSQNVREFTYQWPRGATVLVYSDGLGTHWSLEQYAGLLSEDPSLIAGVLYRDWSRGRDDTTVLALRERPPV